MIITHKAYKKRNGDTRDVILTARFVPIIDVRIISNGIFKWILWQIPNYEGDHVGSRFVHIATTSEFGVVYVILIMTAHHLVRTSPMLEIMLLAPKERISLHGLVRCE